MSIPPIQLRRAVHTASRQSSAILQRNKHLRVIAPADEAERTRIKMIVMIMALQNDIDARQRLNRNRRIIQASRPDPSEWAGVLGPDRIGDEIQSCGLDQNSRMANQRDA